MPAYPNQVYKDQGWAGFGDWLGTGTVSNKDKKFRPFNEARKFARSLGLKNEKQWMDFCKSGDLPDDIPASPNGIYKDQGWAGSGDWFGTGTVATTRREYRPFKEARKFARSLSLKNNIEWADFCKSVDLPDDIPADPRRTYKHQGWAGYPDWLGKK